MFVSQNYLKEFQTEKPQVFYLDTIESKQIIGKNGTKIFFQREYFEVLENKKITLELIELYDFKEILYRKINTETIDNKLLETNGVLSISFTVDGKKINLKKNKKLIVYPPKGRIKNYDIFIAKKDSLGNIKWKMTSQKDTLFSIHIGGNIWIERLIKKDSIPYLKKINKDTSGFEVFPLPKDSNVVEDYFTLNNDEINWINFDKIKTPDFKLNFNLRSVEKHFSSFDIYFTYDSLNSFISTYRFRDELNFKDIPVNGRTWMTVICEKNKVLYYDKIELKKEMDNSEITLKMKKTNRKELQKLIVN